MKTSQDFEKERPEYSNPTVAKIWSLVEFYDYSLKKASEELGLRYSYVRKLASLNHIHRFKPRQKVTKLLPSQCPECHGTDFSYDKETGETTCTNCGLVRPQSFSPLQRVPHGTTAALVSELSFGKSLGTQINRRDLYSVLAKGPNEKGDLGLRAIHIRNFTQTVDHPATMKMLAEGSQLLKELRLFNDANYSQNAHIIGDSLGATIRKVAAYIILSKTKIRNRRHLVSACLYYTLGAWPDLFSELMRDPEKATLIFRWTERELRLVGDVLEIGKQKER